MQLAKLLIFIIVISVITSCITKAKSIASSSPKIRPAAAVKISGEYKKIIRVKDLPASITNHFNKDKNCAGLANPDDEFNFSDYSTKRLPCSKLVAAGNAGDIWFIEFVTGGVGVSQTFLSFRLKDNLVTSLGNIYNQAQLVKLSIKDLDNQLSNFSCNKDNYFQYYFQIKYGVCPSPKEGRFVGMTPNN